ncbi:MAG TPA: ABATE domain-containing protein [Anaerolineales bacterium]|nr:ABATE domain-containing protein [Anaerolineales bacterium]
MSKNYFDLESGDLSLDYANTADWHASETPAERLNSYSDLITWAEESRLVSATEARKLHQLAQQQPEAAVASYQHAIQVREAIYAIFSSHYHGQPVPADALALLNDKVREAMSHLQLVQASGQLRWEWAPGVAGPNLILWSVARAAAELLTSERLRRVRECEDDRGCGYLFIDQSKNRSRRWCSMDSCGNRAKARRHYARLQDMHIENIE